MAIDINNINWDDLEWEEVREGIRRKTYQGEQATVTYNEAYRGHEIRPHSHPAEQIVVWTEGECDFYVDGVVRKMTGGSIMSIPGNAEHYVIITGDGPNYNFDIFVPARREYGYGVKKKK